MCGRYTETTELKKLQERFRFAPPTFELKPRFNLAPSQEAPVIVLSETGERRLELFRWGLVPHWAKDPKIGYKMINARADTLEQKPSYREPFKKRRCLVLADGFYEWRQIEPKVKVPMRIVLHSREPFAMAGLWEQRTFTIVTTEANKKLMAVHQRMPVILRPELEQAWLDPETEPKDLKAAFEPYPDKLVEAYAVTTAVNSPKNDVPELIRPV